MGEQFPASNTTMVTVRAKVDDFMKRGNFHQILLIKKGKEEKSAHRKCEEQMNNGFRRDYARDKLVRGGSKCVKLRGNEERRLHAHGFN